MNLIKAEIKKTLKEAINYYPDYIVALLTDFFVLLLLMKNDGSNTLIVLTYVLWILVTGVMSEASICISSEKQMGTLQNLMIKPYSIIKILSVKTFVWFMINFVKASLLIAAVTLLFKIGGLFRIQYAFITFAVCFGIMGISYMLSALTLMFTKVASFVNVIGYMLLMLSGSVIDVPEAVKYSNPLSFGAKCIANVLDGCFTATDCTVLAVISLLWFAFGICFFNITFSHSRQFKWSY